MELLQQPPASVEYLVVDTETNGRAGDGCELTEVGAVLVGGGELHETWESLVKVQHPLTRGIERLTGITQAMVDSAPPPEQALAELEGRMRGRVLVAHNASFDSRVLAQAFERAGLNWPDPPVLCTVALARKCAPLVRQRKLALLADSLGIEVDVVHRALPDAVTCARILCALLPRLCASAGTVADAVGALRSTRRRRSVVKPAPPVAHRRTGPTSSTSPTTQVSTYSAMCAAGRCTSASRFPCARAHEPTSALRPVGPSAPKSSTTARRTPSWGRSCWRTG